MQNSPKLEDRIGRGKFLKTLGALALAGALALPGCAGVQTTANTNGNIPKMDGVWIMETTRGNNKIQISQDGDYYEGKLIDGLGGNFTPGYKYLYGNVSPDGTISCNLIFPDGLRYHKSDLVGNDQFCRSLFFFLVLKGKLFVGNYQLIGPLLLFIILKNQLLISDK